MNSLSLSDIDENFLFQPDRDGVAVALRPHDLGGQELLAHHLAPNGLVHIRPSKCIAYSIESRCFLYSLLTLVMLSSSAMVSSTVFCYCPSLRRLQ
jgi:hypothetical protein